jgi:hypothetical protein
MPKARTVTSEAEELLVHVLNADYDTVISTLKGLDPLTASALVWKLSEFAAVHDPYKAQALFERLEKEAK